MTGNPGAGPHPELAVLADLDADALDPAAAEEVRVHVADCATCGESLRALAQTRSQLAALADPPLPAEVSRALDARLETLRAAPVVPAPVVAAPTAAGEVQPLRPVARRRWPVSLPGAAAAAVVTLFLAAIGVGALNSDLGDGEGADLATSGDASDSGASGGGGEESGPMTLAAPPAPIFSGRNYTAATVVEAASAGVGQRADAMAAPQAPTATVPAALQRLSQSAALQSCLTALGEGRPATPLVLDYASYEGAPALVVVLPEDGDTDVGVWVVGPDCAAGNADLRYFVRAARPAG